MPKPDLEKYRPFVDRFDLPEAARKDLLESLWRIMESFVDRAFNADPVQLVHKGPDAKRASGQAPVIDCKNAPRRTRTLTATFGPKARDGARKES